jgi:hypothetical protein
MNLILMFALWSLVAWVVLAWPRHADATRRTIRLTLLGLGLTCLAVAPSLSGSSSEDVTLFIFPNAYVVETIERSHTGLAVGAGALFLALFALARWGRRWAPAHPLLQALALTLGVILVRISLEKLGVPRDVAVLVGIIWLIVPIGVFFGWKAAEAGSVRKLVAWVLGYGVAVRVFIVLLMLVTSHLGLGTHFDNSGVTHFTFSGEEYSVASRSWEQYRALVLAPQLTFWLGVTLAAGFLFGLPTYWLASRGSRGREG